MARNKIGFHLGPGGDATGIGNYMARLDQTGIPFMIKSVDNYGPCFEASQYTGADHAIAFRLSTAGQNDGYDYDVPDYNKPAHESADEHWNRTLQKLPPEFSKSVWLEVINEVDKNKSDWLGHFAYRIGQLALNQGYRVSLFGWSSGEPEKTDWKTDGMRSYLGLCATQPHSCSIALHEYSYDVNNIKDGYPYKIGRFQELFDACDEMDIFRPKVLITEWGWEYQNVPDPTQGVADIDWAARLYAQHHEILGAAIWYLGGGWDHIARKAQKLIEPVTNYTVNTELPGDTEPPPIDPPQEGQWTTVIDEQFEGYNDPTGSDWYDQDVVQQVRVGTTLEWTDGENHQGDRPYGLMEAIFRWDAFVPPDEQDTLLNDVGHAYKMFAREQAWKSWSKYQSQPAGRYRVTLVYYDDNYVQHSPKVPPPDPLSFESRIGIGDESIPWLMSKFLQENTVTAEFELEAEGQPWFRFRGRWAILNVSAWAHRFKVERWEGENPPIDPPVDPPSECEDEARVPYRREYWVIPNEATDAQAGIIFSQSLAKRTTVGFSYDDAGVGAGLSAKDVVLYGIPASRHQEFIDWYALHYAGVTSLVFRELPETGGRPFDFTHWPTEFMAYSYPQGYFGSRPDYYGQWGLPGHEGVDLEAPDRTQIYAVADGTVVDVRMEASGHNYGRFLRIRHIDGYETTYAHMDTITVSVRDTIEGGALIGLADSTGNSSGSHLHLTLKNEDAYEGGPLYIGYPSNIVDPTPFITKWLGDTPPTQPPATGNAGFGIHGAASGAMAPNEPAMITSIVPDIIKVLSSVPPEQLAPLRQANPQAKWIVRAFLEFGGRSVTADQFVNWTLGDTQRTISNLQGTDYVIELHNEPNLTMEGLGSSWNNGTEFAEWWIEVLRQYKIAIPNARFIYPGLSPGADIPDVRQNHQSFFTQSWTAWQVADGVGIHAYWAYNYPMSEALNVVDWYVGQVGERKIWVTEASNNKPASGADKGQQYIDFWKALRQRPTVQGVTYFISSATSGTFPDEIWITQQGHSTGIAEVVAGRSA